ncbi:hypothetical protein GGS23DRAFT_611932 [Durotheca rogersii]|uniref:uncharacterized protein n=1 Tax=Durotheca rogersii TaxID=419775 RepID=UPI0022200A05|nr:uncharacterized protein GGS23DRAFT_611932 [Durotheca rogersii]KAI5861391.1 hypothetical protein GGS23DRAFT_611932 [Durotheca rogersii]
MPSFNLEYPTQPYSKVNRHNDRASYALETIHEIVNTCPILHVSFADPGAAFPAVLPMIGQMGSFERPSADVGDVLDLYLHGHVGVRLASRARADADGGGLPVCVAATHLDGLVLALTPFSSSYNYRSAVLFGRAVVVADPAEQRYALELITDSVVPGRYRGTTRSAPAPAADPADAVATPAEIRATAVLRVRITAGSAKGRAGPPADTRADLADLALRRGTWAGVVPVRYELAAPVPAPYNQAPAVPAYLDEYRAEFNRAAAEGAAAAAREGEGWAYGKGAGQEEEEE